MGIRDLCRARLDDYDFTWLDDLCLSGRVVVDAPVAAPRKRGQGGRGPGAHRADRAAAAAHASPLWNRLARTAVPAATRCWDRARRRVADHLRAHGASFFDEIVDGTGLLRTDVENALAELVVAGRRQLRQLRRPARAAHAVGKAQAASAAAGRRRARDAAASRTRAAGRCARRGTADVDAASAPTRADADVRARRARAAAPLRRRVLAPAAARSAWLPPWRDMLRVLRRLEARGEIRGGRFVAGVSGEQFALPEAVSALRETRRAPMSGALVSVSGADPLNLVGVLAAGRAVPALSGNRVLYRDGIAVATLVAGEIEWLEKLDTADARAAEDALVKRQSGAPRLAYLR